MARKIFMSFRFKDGAVYKNELDNIFDESTEIINRSEDEDRSAMSEETIRKYLYDKLKGTSVTVVLLTPKALNHQRVPGGSYDDWMYDEIRYSLEKRENNKTNGLIAVYTPEVEMFLFSKSTHTCPICNKKRTVTVVTEIDNLARKNMMNVFEDYKKEPCNNLYDSTWDSYCSFVSWAEFKDNYVDHIEKAAQKREMLYKYDIKKRLP